MTRYILSVRVARLLLVVALLVTTANTVLAREEMGLAQGSRESQIQFWEGEIHGLREGSLSKALGNMYAAQRALEEARRAQGWIFTSESDKARIKSLDEDFRRRAGEVAVLQHQEQMMVDRLKPLYGIVSRRFVQEQRETIVKAMKTVQKLSYDNAWYSSLFNVHNAETLTDIIVGFLGQWLMGYVLMYPFAAAYYALWEAPWSIYAYMSGPSDILFGVAAWVVSVLVMLLPIIALVGGFLYIQRVHGVRIHEALRTARERERRR